MQANWASYVCKRAPVVYQTPLYRSFDSESRENEREREREDLYAMPHYTFPVGITRIDVYMLTADLVHDSVWFMSRRVPTVCSSICPGFSSLYSNTTNTVAILLVNTLLILSNPRATFHLWNYVSRIRKEKINNTIVRQRSKYDHRILYHSYLARIDKETQ